MPSSRAQRGQTVEQMIRSLPKHQQAAAARGLEIVRSMQARGAVSPHLPTAIRQTNEVWEATERRIVEEGVAAHHNSERMDSAAREISRFAARIGPEEIALINEIYAAGGWSGLKVELAGFLSGDALQVMENTYNEAGSLEGLRAAVVQRMSYDAAQEQAAAAESQAQDRWDPAKAKNDQERSVLEASPVAEALRSPEFQANARKLLATRGRELREVGLEIKKGETPAEAVIRFALQVGPDGRRGAEETRIAAAMKEGVGSRGMQPDEVVGLLSQAFGKNDRAMRQFLAQAEQGAMTHRLSHRMAEHDPKRPKAPEPDATVKAYRNDTADLRKTVRSAARQAGVSAKPPPMDVGGGDAGHLRATIAKAMGRDVRPMDGDSRETVNEVNEQFDGTAGDEEEESDNE